MKETIREIRIPFKLPLDRTRSVDRFVNAWLVGEAGACLVDTGPAGTTARIAEALSERGMTLKDIRRVINTHEHADHVGGNHAVRSAAAAGVEFMCHTAAAAWIEDLDLQCRLRPIFAFHELAGQAVTIDRRLQEGDVVDLGDGTTLEVIATPGHSAGSISLYCPQAGALITGDLLQPVGKLPLYGDLPQTRSSLRRLLALPNVSVLYASHAERPCEGAEVADALHQSLEYLERVDALVKEALAELPAPQTPEAVTRRVLTRLGFDPPPVMAITVASIRTHMTS
jgi:glyoxylase-like metal-dependent hydrolase (beta-lactamase superfamily II)